MSAGRLLAVLSFFLIFTGMAAGMAPRDPFVAADPTDPDVALREGNRLFEEGELEEAMTVYAAGYGRGAAEVDPLLAYNLGTTAHHLGRLPEALLWYRRAQAAAHDDPWLRENLETLRRSLGTAGGPASAWGIGAKAGLWLSMTGVVLAWASLALFALGRQRGVLGPLALLACALFGAGFLLEWKGPRTGVLLETCPTGKDGLPAGTEVVVLPDGPGFRVLGEPGLRCPGEVVGLVEP
ncbi:MAG TPA: tetratricopeptide repeat protein [Thermoanaerobaculia bacterium]|nr:tetratricopeptide repeat protein [Thermoanaerobaculia bacterium]